jgi:arsenate reductase (thioredoxin)
MRRVRLERNILFLCEDNSRLSQMAEAAAKHLSPPRTRIFSAGVKPSTIPSNVIEAMKELGISMTGQRSKSVTDVPMNEIDLIVSFGEADKQCNNLPGRAKIERWPVPQAFQSVGASAPALSAVRQQRDEIDKRVFALFLDHWRNVV